MNEIDVIGILKDKFIRTKRLSGTVDVLPVLIDSTKGYEEGRKLEIHGKIKTFNDANKKLHVVIQADDVKTTDKLDMDTVVLEGYICRKPNLRETPFGREISDLIIAVEGSGKNDYIPCITWGKDARKAAFFDVGTKVMITGRLQSRTYTKRTETASEERTAYEVSVETINKV